MRRSRRSPSGGLISATSATTATGSCLMEVTAGRTRRLGTAQVELQCRAGTARWRIWRRIASPLTPRVVLSTSSGLGYHRARWVTTPRSFGQRQAGLDVEGVEDTLSATIWVATCRGPQSIKGVKPAPLAQKEQHVRTAFAGQGQLHRSLCREAASWKLNNFKSSV